MDNMKKLTKEEQLKNYLKFIELDLLTRKSCPECQSTNIFLGQNNYYECNKCGYQSEEKE